MSEIPASTDLAGSAQKKQDGEKMTARTIRAVIKARGEERAVDAEIVSEPLADAWELADAIEHLGPKAEAARTVELNLSRARTHLAQARGYVPIIDHRDGKLRDALLHEIDLVHEQVRLLEEAIRRAA